MRLRNGIIDKWPAALAGAATLLLLVNVLVDVSLRHFGFGSLPGTIDFVAYWWMPIVAYLGLSLAHTHGEHIRVTILADNLPPVAKKSVNAIVSIILVAFLALVAWFGLLDALERFDAREYSSATGIEIWIGRFAVPLGALLFMVSIVLELLQKKNLKGESYDSVS